MSLLDNTLPHNVSPVIDRNKVKWSGYFASTEQAQEHLEKQSKHFAITENKLVVSATKDFINRHFKGYFLYRFALILSDRY
jgi:hypothetical protein